MTEPVLIGDLCEHLVAALASRGFAVGANLQPGLPVEAIKAAVAPLGIELPEDVIALYQWRNGHIDDESESVLWFRDTQFLSLQQAIEIYRSLNDPDLVEQTLELFGVDLKHCFPISAYEGCTYVIALGEHPYEQPTPIIQVFEGVDRYFHSLPAMLQTSVAWVEHADWDIDGMEPDAEMDIWQRLNPGLFDDEDEDY